MSSTKKDIQVISNLTITNAKLVKIYKAAWDDFLKRDFDLRLYNNRMQKHLAKLDSADLSGHQQCSTAFRYQIAIEAAVKGEYSPNERFLLANVIFTPLGQEIWPNWPKTGSTIIELNNADKITMRVNNKEK